MTSHSVSLVLESPDELVDCLGEVRRFHDVFVAELAFETMELDWAPGFSSRLQRRPVQLIAQLVGNHAVVLCVHNHDGRPEFWDVLIRLKSEPVLVNWLQDRRLKPRQIAEKLSQSRVKRKTRRKTIYRHSKRIIYVIDVTLQASPEWNQKLFHQNSSQVGNVERVDLTHEKGCLMTSSRMLLNGASSITPLGLSMLLLLTIETMWRPIPVPTWDRTVKTRRFRAQQINYIT